MLLLASVCGIAGTWQIFRFEQKHDANQQLRIDDSDRPVDVTAALGPASAPTSNGQAQKFRHITATGSYLPAEQTLLRGQTINGDIGYLVITPLKTPAGVLLIARGFIPQTGVAKTSPTVPTAPSGQLTVTARLQPADSKTDRFGSLPGEQVDTVNPTEQASRIGSPVWNGYAELLPGQPGTGNLQVIPGPDLSNPAGGAEEPQHLAYVVQWYLFAILALSAPFILARAERKRDEVAPTSRRTGTEPGSTGPTSSTGDDDPAGSTGDGAPSRKARKASLDDRLAGRA